MPWKRRGKSKCFYRSVRVNGRTTTQYLGRGDLAQLAVDSIARREAKLKGEREAHQVHCRRWSEASRALLNLVTLCDVLLERIY
jgi:hypothetical protein